jgi:glycosyltransferase involved in cell wall biosynthesis
MKILIDLQACQSASRFRGIGRYSLALAKAMIRNAGLHDIAILLNASFSDSALALRQEFSELLPNDKIHVFQVPTPTREVDPTNIWNTHAAELIREYAIAELQPDVLHISSLFEGFDQDIVSSVKRFNSSIIHAITLYDLIPYFEPETHLTTPQHKVWYQRRITELKKADCLLAISEYTKQEAIQALQLNTSSITNIAGAVDACFKPIEVSNSDQTRINKRFKIHKPFIMYMGSADAHKNLDNMIKAFALLPEPIRNQYQLVIVSQMTGAVQKRLSKLALENELSEESLCLTGHVTDEDLVLLYNTCETFVFPSLREGFGLPILEAMSCGAVVISSNTSSMPEITVRTDAMFDPRQPQQIARVLERTLVDQQFRHDLRNHAQQRASGFSWDRSGKIAINAFENLLKNQISPNVLVKKNYPMLLKALQKELKSYRPKTSPVNQPDFELLAQAIAQNTNQGSQRQILVDVSDLVKHDHRTGIQRVVRSIIQAVQQNTPFGYRLRLIYGDSEQIKYRYVTRIGKNGGISPNDPVIDINNGDIFLGLDFTAHLFPRFNPVLEHMNMVGVKIIYVVYDLIPLNHAHFFDSGMPRAFSAWIESLAERAFGLICISKAVADDVLAFLDRRPPIRPNPIRVGYFHLGADIGSSLPSKGLPANAKQILEKFNQAPTFIMVGTVEPRKGHRQTLAAFNQLWGQGIQVNLVIVGKIGWNMDDFHEMVKSHPQLDKSLVWLQKISDEYLEKVYTAASAIIVASEAEGFGLPLIEAAQKKIPIIARDLPVFREVAGQYAHYFSGLEPENLTQALLTWLALNQRKEIPSSANMPWLTWSQSGEQLMRVINGNDSSWYASYKVDPTKLFIDLNTPILGNNHKLVFKSWYWWEGEHRWSSGKSSEIIFRMPPTNVQAFVFSLDGISFGTQPLRFELNGFEVHECVIAGELVIEFSIGAHMIQDSAPNNLTIFHESATTPNSEDLRVLAYGFRSMEIKAI